jgi:hypothetical protein
MIKYQITNKQQIQNFKDFKQEYPYNLAIDFSLFGIN